MESLNKPYVLGNYEITLSRNDAELNIQAFDLSLGHQFFKPVNDDIAKQLVGDQSLDTEKIHQLLKDYFDNKPDKASVSLTNDGKLTYTCLLLFGPISQKFASTIQLESKQIDPVKNLQRLVSTLSNTVNVLNEKIDEMQKRISKLESSSEESKNAGHSKGVSKLWVKSPPKWEVASPALKTNVKVPEFTLEIEVDNPGNLMITFNCHFRGNVTHLTFFIDGKPFQDLIQPGSIPAGSYRAENNTGGWMHCNFTQFAPIEPGKHVITLIAHTHDKELGIHGGEVRCLYIP